MSISRRRFLQITGALATVACGDPAVDGDDLDKGAKRGDPGAAPGRADGAASAAGGDPGAGIADVVDGAGAPAPGAQVRLVKGVDLDAIPLRARDFPYGVMGGDATSSAAMLWTRYIGTAGTLHVQIEPIGAPKGDAAISRPVAAAERGEGGFVHVDATGLVGGTRYRYAFFVVEANKPAARGPFGYVRAALAPGALETVTFGGTSCSHQQAAPYPLLGDAAKRRLDFFLHAGDHVYTDAGVDATTRAEYRAKYAEAWGTAGMSALHGSTGMVLAWDDHEILNNYDPETLPKARIDAGRAAFFEHRATRRDPVKADRLYRSLAWGDTLELFVLDVRSERKPSTRTTATCQFISPEQLAWLQDRLARSTAVFKFIVTSVPITSYPAALAGNAADKWQGYAAQRAKVLDFVATSGIKGVWWLSGDLHFGSVGRVEASGPRSAMREVLMGPAGSTPRVADLAAPQFDASLAELNYTVLQADPVKRELTVEFIGPAGPLFKRTYAA